MSFLSQTTKVDVLFFGFKKKKAVVGELIICYTQLEEHCGVYNNYLIPRVKKSFFAKSIRIIRPLMLQHVTRWYKTNKQFENIF